MTPGEEPDPRLRAFLREQRLQGAGETAVWTPLAGGVSSDIWRVDLPRRSLCVKRALPQLRVAQQWHAPVERNTYEWRWIEFAAVHCPGTVPEPIASDAALCAFAMEFLAPDTHPVWKRLLLDGNAPPGVAAQVGTIIGKLHSASAGDADVACRFPTDAIFHAIRLEPYLLATGERHPELAPRLRALVERTAGTHLALVHGDVSPKNILIGPRGPVFLDAECAWYGDPAFDVAFCLDHFLLKCVARWASTDDYLACFDAFAAAYFAVVDWEPRAEIESRVASLLPALFLARVDGKSPVEYITEERDRRLVRETACPLIVDPPQRIAEVSSRWRDALAAALQREANQAPGGAGMITE
jgi:aminoglycoside phosphotransferase (APT) family kinase protein